MLAATAALLVASLALYESWHRGAALPSTASTEPSHPSHLSLSSSDAHPPPSFPTTRERLDDGDADDGESRTAHLLCRPFVDGRQQFEWAHLNIPSLPLHSAADLLQVILPEVDVDLTAGRIRIPLFERTYGEATEAIQAQWPALSFLEQRAAAGQLQCRTLHSDETMREETAVGVDVNADVRSNSSSSWRRVSFSYGRDEWPWLSCSFDPAQPPPRLLFLHHLSPVGWEDVALFICPYRLPRVFATALIKGSFGVGVSQLHHQFDFISYHLRMGLDYTYVIDQTDEQALLEPFRPLIARGLVRYLAWPKAYAFSAQQMQNTVFHVWSKQHSVWAWPADVDELLVIHNRTIEQRSCPRLSIHCPSPLQSALSGATRYSNASAIIVRPYSFPAWPMPAQTAQRYPQDTFRYAHNDSYYRQMAYSGGDLSQYLPHAARFLFRSSILSPTEQTKTIHHTHRVQLVRTHDAWPSSAEHPLLDLRQSSLTDDDLAIFHYRHMWGARAMPAAHENEPTFWDNVTRQPEVADVLLNVRLPTAVSDFMSLYPVDHR